MHLLSNTDYKFVSGGVFDVGDIVKVLLGGVVYLSLTPTDLSYRNGLKLFIGAGAMLGGYNFGSMGAEYGGSSLSGKVTGWALGTLIGCVGGAFAGGLGMKIYGNVTRWTYLLFDDGAEAE